jgi:hypothetical protein
MSFGTQELIIILGGLFCVVGVPLAIVLIVLMTKKKGPPQP